MTRAKCPVEFCERLVDARGLCSMHYKRFKRTGSTDRARGEMGKGSITSHGYRSIEHNGKAKYEHVLLAEKALGHSLPKGALVHHVNGNKLDNRPSNLVICPDQHYHAVIHARTKFLGYFQYDKGDRK